MKISTDERLFGFRHAFDHPVTALITLGIAALLLITPLVIMLLSRGGRIDAAHRDELIKRFRSWLLLAPLMTGPVLLGAAWTMVAVGLLSLLCYGEFARATGLFREKMISFIVVLGTVLVTLAALDNWFSFFLSLFPLTTGTIAAVAILADRPHGYLQRVALGVLGFSLFGCALGHLSYFANDANYRPLLLALVLTVQLNDVFAYVAGKTLGRRVLAGRKLAPNTSPNKTIAGALGALVLTIPLVMVVMHAVLRGTALDHAGHLLVLALIIGLLGQLGDLVLSSIKRDLGLKDMGSIFPGHGGLLDRFDSLILVAPGVFHYVNAWAKIGRGQETQIISRFFSGG